MKRVIHWIILIRQIIRLNLMNNPPDLSICLSVNFMTDFGDGLSVSIHLKGAKGG